MLVRKQVGENISISGNYYVDSVTSASIDVVTTASAYTEERTEKSISADYLNDKTTLTAAYIQSDESDFSAESFHFNISQEFFGDLSTLTIGYSKGNDEIGRSTDPTFSREATRQHFRLACLRLFPKTGLSAVIWKRLLMKAF